MQIDPIQNLFDTLDRRIRPEDVARMVQDTLTLSADERKEIAQV